MNRREMLAGCLGLPLLGLGSRLLGSDVTPPVTELWAQRAAEIIDERLRRLDRRTLSIRPRLESDRSHTVLISFGPFDHENAGKMLSSAEFAAHAVADWVLQLAGSQRWIRNWCDPVEIVVGVEAAREVKNDLAVHACSFAEAWHPLEPATKNWHGAIYMLVAFASDMD